MSRIKLLSLWVGDTLPHWFPKFEERVKANSIVDWSLIQMSREALNELASRMLKIKCQKESAYAQCDLRPFLPQIFPDLVGEFEWWGWCDFDIVIGDLDNLLPPLLDNYDVISVEPFGTAGAMTLLRNSAQVTSVIQRPGWKKAMESPTYENWDETAGASLHVGNRESSLTTSVLWSGLRVRFDDRSWADSWYQSGNEPTRTCRVEGKKVIEVPVEKFRSERELILYHFSKGKTWPV